MNSQHGFWKWYSSSMKTFALLKWLRHPATEYFVGLFIIVFGSMVMSLYGFPLLLLVTIPAGCIVVVHASWRWFIDRRS